MYYVVKSSLEHWESHINSGLDDWVSHINQAMIEGSPEETKPHWWAARPLTSALPLVTFTTPHGAPMLDNYFTGTIFDLYSTDLISLLHEAKVRFETFPTAVIDRVTREALDKKYQIFHLLEICPGLDMNLSDIDDSKAEINSLVLTAECLQLNKPFFRLAEAEDLVLISDELMQVFESHNMSGLRYVPINEFRVGMRHYFNKFKSGNGEMQN